MTERPEDTVAEVDEDALARDLDALAAHVVELRREIGKAVIGYDTTMTRLLVCLLVRGHALLEGVPGVGKTLFVRTLADVLDLEFRRIQFTPDLMPADVTGTDVLEGEAGGRGFRFRPGPLFGHVVLADEINRATPKTQSALLEAMQEGSVTVGGVRHALPEPFAVFATQNPIEMEGTYALPEAQLDRFTFKIRVPAPDRETLTEVLTRTTGPGTERPRAILGPDDIDRYRALVRIVRVPGPVVAWVVRLLEASRPEEAPAELDRIRRFVRFGAGPRAGQAMLLGAKATALLAGRMHVDFADVRAVAEPALAHRLVLDFEAEAEGVEAENLVADLLNRIPEDSPEVRSLARSFTDPPGDARRGS